MYQLLSVFHQATENEIDRGLAWYCEAHFQAMEIAVHHHLPTDLICGVTAAISPRVPWKRTFPAVERIVTAFEQGQPLSSGTYYPRNGDKAYSMLRDGSVSSWLNGPKVEAFYDNLSFPQYSTRVTVDMHAISAFFGRKMDSREVRYVMRTRDRMRSVERSYQDASEYVGIMPSQFQAIVWLTWRRLVGAS